MSVTRDITPAVRWQQQRVPREPLDPILRHVVFILRNWRPGEFDHLANLAYDALEDVSLRLVDRDADWRSVTDLLSESITMNMEQDRRADRQYTIIAALRDRLRDQQKDAA